jgi:hypothetical protein
MPKECLHPRVHCLPKEGFGRHTAGRNAKPPLLPTGHNATVALEDPRGINQHNEHNPLPLTLRRI